MAEEEFTCKISMRTPMKSRVYPEQEVGTNVRPKIQLRAIDPRRLKLHMV